MFGPQTRAEHRTEVRANTKDRRLHTSIATAINAGSVAESFRSNQGRFLQIGNRRVRLQNADGTLTPAGRHYHDHLGENPPLMYSYEQELEQNQWVRGYNGDRVQIRNGSMEPGR